MLTGLATFLLNMVNHGVFLCLAVAISRNIWQQIRALICKLVQKVIKPCLAHTQHNIYQKSTQCDEIPYTNYSPSSNIMGVSYIGS